MLLFTWAPPAIMVRLHVATSPRVRDGEEASTDSCSALGHRFIYIFFKGTQD